MSYLVRLLLRLSDGIGRLPEEFRNRHAGFLLGWQCSDGGFAGRKGTGDLYYTSFALRSLIMIGRLDNPTADRVGSFLSNRFAARLPSIDFLSLVASSVLLEAATGVDVLAEAGHDRRQSVIDFFEGFRRGDGGYAKTKRSGTGSTYHTFLAVLCKQMVDAPLDGQQRMIKLVRSRQREDGGFVEIDPVRDGGTNPTAAAVGLLRILDGLDEQTRAGATKFLAAMQTREGGLRANARIPVADLLSTFTGLVALADLDALSAIDAPAALRFVKSLQQPDGGFRAGAFDDAADVEYTFYGLGAMALLAAGEG